MKIEIYGKNNCSHCEFAKNLINQLVENYTFYNLSENINLKNELADRMGKTPQSVPQIFVNDDFIGGLSEFRKYIKRIK